MAVIRVNLLVKKSRSNGRLYLLLAVAFAGLLLLSFQSAHAFNSTIGGLKNLQDKSRFALSAIDRDMIQAYTETTKITSREVTTNVASQILNSAKEKIDRLMDQKYEESLRMDLIDKLIFKISERNPQNLRLELPLIVDEIVKSEMGIGVRLTQNERVLIPFLMNLATALRTLPEPIQNPIGFIETYLQFSSITNPRPVTEFTNTQGYLDDSGKDDTAKSAN